MYKYIIVIITIYFQKLNLVRSGRYRGLLPVAGDR